MSFTLRGLLKDLREIELELRNLVAFEVADLVDDIVGLFYFHVDILAFGGLLFDGLNLFLEGDRHLVIQLREKLLCCLEEIFGVLEGEEEELGIPEERLTLGVDLHELLVLREVFVDFIDFFVGECDETLRLLVEVELGAVLLLEVLVLESALFELARVEEDIHEVLRLLDEVGQLLDLEFEIFESALHFSE